MARLTRTQKYAELRDQLENGREIEIKSDALNKFEDKLEQLNIDSVNVKEEVTEAPKEESSELPLEEVNTEVNEEAVIEVGSRCPVQPEWCQSEGCCRHLWRRMYR